MSTTTPSATVSLDVSLDAFLRGWADASMGGFSSGSIAADAAGMGDNALIANLAAVQQHLRLLDVARIALAGQIAERSARTLGNTGMAARAGHSKAALMVAEICHISTPEAYRLCDLGLATRPRMALDGTPLPARYPAIAAAVTAGDLGIDHALVIVKALDDASPRCSVTDRGMGEELLVSRATDFTVGELKNLARQVRDHLDQDGAVPRDELHHQRRGVRFIALSDGMTLMLWDMEPTTAALVKAGIDTCVGHTLRQARDDARRANSTGNTTGADLRDGSRAESSTAADNSATNGTTTTGAPSDAELCDEVRAGDDPRSLDHLRSDAAERIFHHVASCEGNGGDIPAITMVIRMTLEDLKSGLGIATIDGVDETISAGTARRMAGDAGLIPVVLGGPSEVLDFGKTRRLFTTAQKLAFGERDGGCAFGGCAAPPSYTEAHHLIWWSTVEKTDLDNGILLCGFHHHRIHDGGWDIAFQNGVPYFIPPPWVDPGRTPRRGGKVVLKVGVCMNCSAYELLSV